MEIPISTSDSGESPIWERELTAEEAEEQRIWAIDRNRHVGAEPERSKENVGERVSKLIARAGLASRRAAEEMIKEGRVSVNGHFLTEPGLKADPDNDRIVVDGKPLIVTERITTVVLFHKPRNVMTTRDDPGRRTTVFDFLPHKFQHFHPVGRLDFDTSGVLLLTDDGELTHLLTHPSHGAEKTYEARVRGEMTADDLDRLRKGPPLEDGPTQPCWARVIAQREKNALVEVKLKEGRNRQVRRMLEAVGHPVSALRRTDFSGVQLEGLLPGVLRVLLPAEVKALRKRVEGKTKKAPSVPGSAVRTGKKPYGKPAPGPRSNSTSIPGYSSARTPVARPGSRPPSGPAPARGPAAENRPGAGKAPVARPLYGEKARLAALGLDPEAPPASKKKKRQPLPKFVPRNSSEQEQRPAPKPTIKPKPDTRKSGFDESTPLARRVARRWDA